MTDTFDVILAGAGHNALTTAAYLAKTGMTVLILESQDWIGGGVVTKEITAPGFRHDTASVVHGMIQANPMIQTDEIGLLEKYGLSYIYPEATVATLFDDGSNLLTYFDVEKTCESIAAISPNDAATYADLVEKIRHSLPMFVQGMFAPPLPFGSLVALLEQSREGRELIGIMNRSAFDIINDLFESDKVKNHLLKYASENMVAPEEKGTGLVFYIMIGFTHTYQSGIPEGGSGALSEALLRCIEDHGGTLITSAHVETVIVEDSKAVGVLTQSGEEYRASRAVVGCFHPHLLSNYISDIDPILLAEANNTQPGSYSSIVINYALHEAPKFRGMEGLPTPLMLECLPSNLTHMRQEFDDLKYGYLTKHAGLGVAVHTNHDTSRAPEGMATLYMSSFAPYALAEGAIWENEKEKVADRMLATLREHTENMGDENIIARHIASPVDIEAASLSFRRGDIMGIGQYLYQFLGRRPLPEFADYTVPGLDGFYLVGPFMHPGGGVTGGGRAVAIKMLSDMDIDFEQAIANH